MLESVEKCRIIEGFIVNIMKNSKKIPVEKEKERAQQQPLVLAFCEAALNGSATGGITR